MTYRVKHAFYNQEEKGKFYQIGDAFTGEVYDALLSTRNAYREPFIEEVSDDEGSFDDMTKAELIDYAKSKNVPISKRETKAEIIAKLTD